MLNIYIVDNRFLSGSVLGPTVLNRQLRAVVIVDHSCIVSIIWRSNMLSASSTGLNRLARMEFISVSHNLLGL